jgi:hypothetical protein
MFYRLDAMLGSQAHKLQIVIAFLCLSSWLILTLQANSEYKFILIFCYSKKLQLYYSYNIVTLSYKNNETGLCQI